MIQNCNINVVLTVMLTYMAINGVCKHIYKQCMFIINVCILNTFVVLLSSLTCCHIWFKHAFRLHRLHWYASCSWCCWIWPSCQNI